MTLENLLNGAKNIAATTAAYMIIAAPAYAQDAVRYQDSLHYKHEIVDYQGAKQKPVAKTTPAAKKPAAKAPVARGQLSSQKSTVKKAPCALDGILGTIGNIVSKPFRGIYEGAYGASHRLPYGSNAHVNKAKSTRHKSTTSAAPKSDFDNLPPEIQAALRAGSNVKVDTQTLHYERKFSAQLYTQDGRTYGPMAITVSPSSVPVVGTTNGAAPQYTEKTEILPDGTRVTTRTTSYSNKR